jgi:hypothetical protein
MGMETGLLAPYIPIFARGLRDGRVQCKFMGDSHKGDTPIVSGLPHNGEVCEWHEER